jgi:hypothetical protein
MSPYKARRQAQPSPRHLDPLQPLSSPWIHRRGVAPAGVTFWIHRWRGS